MIAPPEFDPGSCQECGTPFNDAEAPKDKVCAECRAGLEQDYNAYDAWRKQEANDFFNSRGIE